MPSYTTSGIVIGRTNFGEADRIIRFLTPDRGKLSAVARGVRKIKSRAAGHLEPFGEVQLMLATGHNLDTITSARLSWYPHQLSLDYTRLGLAFAMATAVDRSTEADHPMPQLYRDLSEAFHALEATGPSPLLELWFKLRLLSTLGYQPELEHCVICGELNPDSTYYFNAERGGLICQTDADATSRPMAKSAIKLWRLLIDYPYATISHISDAATHSQSSMPLADEFYEYHLGRQFHVQAFPS